MTLLTSITSYSKRGLVWAKAGDSVTLIATHGHVLIVETLTGERLPVTIDKIGDYVQEAPAQLEKTILTNRPQANRKAKIVEGQTSLF